MREVKSEWEGMRNIMPICSLAVDLGGDTHSNVP